MLSNNGVIAICLDRAECIPHTYGFPWHLVWHPENPIFGERGRWLSIMFLVLMVRIVHWKNVSWVFGAQKQNTVIGKVFQWSGNGVTVDCSVISLWLRVAIFFDPHILWSSHLISISVLFPPPFLCHPPFEPTHTYLHKSLETGHKRGKKLCQVTWFILFILNVERSDFWERIRCLFTVKPCFYTEQ